MKEKLIYLEFDSSLPEFVEAKHVFFPFSQPFLKHADQYTIYVDYYTIDKHFHNRYELLMVLSGKCNFIINNQLFHLDSNDICLIPPEVAHAFIRIDDSHEHIFLNFTDMYIDKDMSYDIRKLWRAGKYSPLPEDALYFRKLFDEICSEHDNNQRYNNNYLKTCFDRIFIKMLQTPQQFDFPSNGNTPAEEISKVIEHVTNKYKSDISLSEMAKMCHVTPTYFSRLFKKQLGLGFKDFLIHTRLVAARKMLLVSNYSISYVASECGFNDSNYFSVVFKKRFGMSPLEYQKHSYKTDL